MTTWIWEDKDLFVINRELQQLLENGVVSNVISMSLVHVPNQKELYRYTAILIYK